MPSERTGYAPWSLTREAGVQSATVDGTIQVPQNIQPVLDTGFVDEKGDWKGTTSSEETFTIDAPHESVANGAAVLSPQRAGKDFIDMTGYNTLQFALKSSRAGTYGVLAIFGPDTNTFANLTPIAAGEGIRIINDSSISDENVLNDNVNLDVANVWTIFTILADRCVGQSNMQIKITNSSGGSANIDFATRKLV